MYFTEGRLREYENIMQEKPGHDRNPVKVAERRDCKHCLHFDEYKGKCGKKKCVMESAGRAAFRHPPLRTISPKTTSRKK